MMAKKSEKKNKEPKKSPEVRREEIIKNIETTEKFLTIRDSDELLYFNPSDGQWHSGETYLKELTRKKSSINFSTSLFREVRETIKVDTYTDGKSFISPPEWINLRNGALNVRNTEFIARDPEPECKEEHRKIDDLKKARDKEEASIQVKGPSADDWQYSMEKLDRKYEPQIKELRDTIRKKKEEWRKSQTEEFAKFCFTSTIPVKYDPSAACPRIEAFFKSMELGDSVVQGILELFGYCLLKSYPIKKLFLFVGPHDTGKSTVASLLEEFLGDGNYAGLSLDSMMDDRFEKYKLYRMHANISGELANRFIKDTSLLKELMGWDIISVRLMHSQIKFMFRNFAKLIFLANQIPATYETDDAFYPKVQIFEFTKQFKEGEEGTRRKDELMAELTTEGEMSGLLNKAVKALQELLKRGKFKTSKSEQENKELYLIKANPLKYYIENSLTIANEIGEVNDPDGNKIKITKQDVYGNFLGFCKHYRLPALSQTAFFKNLNDYLLKRGIPINRRDTTGKGYYPWLELAVLYTDTKNSDSNSYDDLL